MSGAVAFWGRGSSKSSGPGAAHHRGAAGAGSEATLERAPPLLLPPVLSLQRRVAPRAGDATPEALSLRPSTSAFFAPERIVLDAAVPADALRTAATLLADAVEAATGRRPAMARRRLPHLTSIASSGSEFAGTDADESLDDDPALRGCIVLAADPVVLQRVWSRVPGPGSPPDQRTARLGEAYEIVVNADRAQVLGGGAAGVYYGVATLRQLLVQYGCGVPQLSIRDAPYFALRGVYHDVTRGKVPTRETLFRLVEWLASYKVNHLQLYVEHTFAFAKHADVWAGSDPLTAEDILALDDHCRRHFVELVPSFSTFGHMYMALRSHTKADLNELDGTRAPSLPFSFHDRQAHYTLNPADPGSLEFVRDIVLETAPLFSSPWYNVCCDETFDLGKGKSKDRAELEGGPGVLYLEFLRKVVGACAEVGKRAMYWGDVVLTTPELMSELPLDCVALNWDYSVEAKRRKCSTFATAGVPFVGCPGTQSWNYTLPNIDKAWHNITNMAVESQLHGARGLLTTDWGDYGHIGLLSASFHGFAVGACASWAPDFSSHVDGLRTTSEGAGRRFDAAFSLLELGDRSRHAASVLRVASTVTPQVSWSFVVRWLEPSPDLADAPRDPLTRVMLADMEGLEASALDGAGQRLDACLREFLSVMAGARPRDELAFAELVLALEGAVMLQGVAAALLWCVEINAGGSGPGIARTGSRPDPIDVLHARLRAAAEELRCYDRRLASAWEKRNKMSEYARLRTTMLEAAARLDKLASGATDDSDDEEEAAVRGTMVTGLS